MTGQERQTDWYRISCAVRVEEEMVGVWLLRIGWCAFGRGGVSGVPPSYQINLPSKRVVKEPRRDQIVTLILRWPVYEYRSGRLIEGLIDDDGNFVPAVDSKVIDFKSYRYGKKAIPIYNLPGSFVKKGEKKESASKD
jgi:hypothetical protein